MFTILVVLLYRLGLLSMLFLQEADATDFNDLGKLLLGGVVVAIAVAIGFTLLRMKFQSKNPSPPSFISISQFTGKDDAGPSRKD